jgi:hypothetical protein
VRGASLDSAMVRMVRMLAQRAPAGHTGLAGTRLTVSAVQDAAAEVPSS